ncbi:MFS transporter [Streptomyces sp. NBC_01020]|uniref:MFS transporter n=1 Tax=unclassified Streptomyces TaxID=2593676 RepID=UPI003250C380|nr:MFS transporter [Streptomyces sp. NBC_01020]
MAGSRATVVVMCLCVTLVVGMVSAVNLAIPSLSAGSLHPSAASVLWVVDGYVAVFACLVVPAGAVADRMGRKGVLLTGLGVFTLGCVLAAAAPDVGVLIAGRMLSGVGAAAVLPATLALMVTGAPDHRRSRLIALWASMTGLAAVLGNVGGGAAIQSGSWRSLFLYAAPLALVALLLAAFVAPTSPRLARPVGPVSALLLTLGFLALLFAIVSGPEQGWGSGQVLGAFAAAVVLLALWTVHELREEHPILDPRLLAGPAVRAGAVGMVSVFLGMFGLFYLNGQYLQYVKGYSALGAGVRLLPMAAALLLAPRCATALSHRLHRRTVISLGLLVLAGGLCTVSRVGPDTPYPVYALGAGLTAAGCGLATPLLSETLMSALPADRAGLGSGLQSLTRELGSALGVALTGTLITAGFTARLPAALRGPDAPTTVAGAEGMGAGPELHRAVITAFTDSLSTSMLVLAGLVLAAGALVLTWLPAESPVRT